MSTEDWTDSGKPKPYPDTEYRFTVYADRDIPLGHRPTLREARALARTLAHARYVVMRLRSYPFTHIHRLPL